jgi:hypothetical protein
VTYRREFIRLSVPFSAEICQAMCWDDLFKELQNKQNENKNNYQSRILYLTKPSFQNAGDVIFFPR